MELWKSFFLPRPFNLKVMAGMSQITLPRENKPKNPKTRLNQKRGKNHLKIKNPLHLPLLKRNRSIKGRHEIQKNCYSCAELDW